MADRYGDRDREWERGRRYRGEGYDGDDRERDDRRRGEERGFWERFGDEVRAWFGDEEAQRRRLRDEREERAREQPWGEMRRRGGDAESDRDWGGSGGYEPGDADYTSERYGAGWRSGVRQGPHVGRGPRGYQRSDDRIREDVCERMCDHGALDATEIEVRVIEGEVTLQGSVANRQDKRLAEDLAAQVSGVRDVHNQLRLRQDPTAESQSRPYRAA